MKHSVEIKAITPEETCTLRRELLRPDCPIEDSIYPGDGDPATQHWGALVDNALVAVASLYPEAMPESVEEAVSNEQSWRLRGMAVNAQF